MQIKQAVTKDEREGAYRLRYTVFVEEQNVPIELERDEHDETDATHFIAVDEGETVGTARILIKGDAVKVQRVAVDKSKRGTGLGRRLMLHIMDHAPTIAGVTTIVLDAQMDALPFYDKLGFVAEGGIFDDASIPHRTMRYRLES